MLWEAFILGLSSGTYCATACAPVALPFLSSRPQEKRPYTHNALLIALFLGGRLAGYVSVGAALSLIGAYTLSYVDPAFSRALSRAAFAAAGALMIAAGLAESLVKARICALFRKVWRPGMGAFIFGLLTGASVCPPFFAAAARVFAAPSTGGLPVAFSGAWYFLFFFLGTSVWIVPLLALPALLGKTQIPRFITRSAMVMIGVYFLLVVGLLGVA